MRLQGPIGRIQRGLENAAATWDYSLPVLKQPILSLSLRTLAGGWQRSSNSTCARPAATDIDQWERIHLVP